MRSKIYEEIKKILGQDLILESPKKFAHFATPLAFSLAKKEKRSPAIIAEELAQNFHKNAFFERIETAGGYLNFTLSKSFLNEQANAALKDPENFAKGGAKNEKFLLEFVSANPTGPLHIGHARGAIFGDTLARLARQLGYIFDTEYYVNDAGNQITKLGLSIFLNAKLLFGEKLELPDGCYKGEYIVDLAREAIDLFGEDFFKKDEQESEAELSKLASWAKDKMLDLIKKNLLQADIKIDKYVSETSFYNELDRTLKMLKKHGGIYEKEGKIWLASSQKNDEKDRVILREDGSGTYLAADIVYHQNKLGRAYDFFINIWGADHHGYISRMNAAVEFLGFDPARLEFILAQMVSLLKNKKPYKMSKRAGNFVLMSEVIDEIGAEALRFIFLSKKCDTHLEFDVDELKKQDSSNPVFYVNYAHARIHQIFAKVGLDLSQLGEDILAASFENLNEDGVILLFEALNLKAILEDAFQARALQKIPDYLKNLAALFHKFYNENKILNTPHEASLLKLCATVALSIKTALKIMGIEAKKRMG